MRRDSNLLQGLTAAGFAIASDPNHSGLMVKYFSPGGGYYIDTGASQLIADTKVKITQGQEVRTIKAQNLVLADGSGLEAGEIVFWNRVSEYERNSLDNAWGRVGEQGPRGLGV